MAATAAGRGEIDEGLRLCDDALRACRASGTSCARVFIQEAIILKQAGRTDDARQAFDEAVAEDPGVVTRSHRAKFLLDTNHPAAALDDLNAILAETPDEPEQLIDRGRALVLLGRFDAAKADFTRAIELDPYEPAAWAHRANVYLLTGRFRPAADDFTQALRLDDTLAVAYLGRAQVAFSEQRFADAAADVERAGRLDPENPQVHYLRGVLAWSRRDAAGAVEHLSEAIRRLPNLEVAYRVRASCYLALGDIARARADVAQVRRLGGTPNPAVVRALQDAPN
jgi:tetratricopeptide (TPR) repeat protein